MCVEQLRLELLRQYTMSSMNITGSRLGYSRSYIILRIWTLLAQPSWRHFVVLVKDAALKASGDDDQPSD